ncbi:MAG TPA: tetratricopeptide repeat protein [Gemmatimonadales bacterium]
MHGLEGRPELANELALFNRVGDLYLKLQKVPEAVEMYERAANLYAEYGFPNNAIALCNKVLRNAPGRTHMYLRLAQLMVERGLIAQAKENLLEYADRMQSAGKTDDAFRALKEFADLSPDNEEIRLLLAEQLKGAARTAEAREQLAKLFAEAEATGDKRRSRQTLLNIKAIDPDFDPTKAPKTKIKQRQQKSSDLVFLDLDEEYRTDAAGEAIAEEPEAEPAAAAEVSPADEAILIEPTTVSDADVVADDLGLIQGLEVREEFTGEAVGTTGLELEPTSLSEAAEEAVESESRASFEVPDLDLGELDLDAATEVAELELPSDQLEEEIEEASEEEFEKREEKAEPEAPVTIATLEARVADDPDDPQHHVVLGEALVEAGQRERGIEELDIALALYEGAEKWKDVARLVAEILRLEPNSVRHHQKRVEGAFRSGEKRDMVQAYLGLANTLLRSGVGERSEMVFRRVLEYDPGNAEALTALASLVPEQPAAPPTPAPAAAARADYVDLGALIFEDDATRDTRMRVEDEEPTGDEEKDFADMLAQFKRGIEANIEDEDWQAHYDLGVAFKEMGLVDEAIAEFQKALRSPPGRLRTAEALGSCFFDKRQFSVAATVMRRAVETDLASDDAKIGLLYWLGRCEEEMGRTPDALAWFQRVFALDIRFADVADRVERLAAAGH